MPRNVSLEKRAQVDKHFCESRSNSLNEFEIGRAICLFFVAVWVARSWFLPQTSRFGEMD